MAAHPEPTLRQLRYFVTLAETGQYRRAAVDLGIAQPSLSQQIATLEDTLGLRLFERGRGGVLLTPPGREMVQRARRILDEVAALGELSEELQRGLSGTLRLGSTPTIGPYFLPSVLRDLHRDFPDLRLVLRDAPPAALFAGLQDGSFDLVLTQLPAGGDRVRVGRLFREALLLAVSRDHPLAAKSEITGADLKGHDILSLSPDYALHAQTARLCEETGAVLRRDYEGTSLDALRQMAAMNMGAALLPRLYTRSEARGAEADVRLLPFKSRGPWRSVGLAWREGAGRQATFEHFHAACAASLRGAFAGELVPEDG